MMKLLMLLTLLPLMAIAQNTKGGGGGIVVACYDKDGELATVELLDLYEARAKGLKTKTETFSENLNQDINTIAKKISINADYTASLVASVDMIMKAYKPIPRDAELELTNDAYPAFLPKSCKAKQVANYYNDRLIWIDLNLYEKMNYVNQLALAFHEEIYAEERMGGVSTSRYTRTIIGFAFSTENPFNLPSFQNMTHYCWSDDHETVNFLAGREESFGSSNIWTFSFTQINGHGIYSKKTGQFFIPEFSVFGQYPSGSGKEIDPDTMNISTTVLDSKINGNEGIMVRASANKLFLSWIGTDPGDSFKDIEVKCTKLP